MGGVAEVICCIAVQFRRSALCNGIREAFRGKLVLTTSIVCDCLVVGQLGKGSIQHALGMFKCCRGVFPTSLFHGKLPILDVLAE